LFGLARGLVIVVVAFLFFNWLVQPPERQPDWVRNAKSRVVLENTGKMLMSMLPDDPEGYLRRFRGPREGEEPPTEPAAPPAPQQRGAASGRAFAGNDEQPGYDRADLVRMQQLLDATVKQR
jgi:membrane protein required for colicin V production